MATVPDSLPPDVVQALKLGRPVEAIKRLRKSTGIGFAEAKALVDAFSGGNTAYQPPGANPMPRKPKVRKSVDEPRPSESHAGRHQIIQPPVQPQFSRAGLGQGEVPNSNASFWLVVLLVIVALVGYYVLER